MKVISTVSLVCIAVQICLSQVEYTGIIRDENGEQLIYASILSIEELKEWQTDFDGEYEFVAPKNLEVYVTYTGFQRLKTILEPRDT